ncbi:MAG: HAMP domain-containing protein [Elusimicrobia bacterium]|nr:HAMP domain-containing protein [Elusimicrobiota bacterium]
MTLFNRLLLIIFGIGLIPIIPTSVFLFYYQSVAKSNILSLHENLSVMASKLIAQNFEDLDKRLAVFAEMDRKSVSVKEQKDLIKKAVANNQDFLLTVLLNEHGVEEFKEGINELKRRFGEINLSNNPCFVSASRARKSVVCGFEFIYNLPVGTVIYPFNNNDYGLFLSVDFRHLFARLSSQRIGASGGIFLADSGGRILDLNGRAPNINSELLKESFVSGRKSFGYMPAETAVYIGAFERLGNSDFFSVALQKRDEAFHGINLITSLIIFFMLAVATVFYFSALVLSRKLISPIQELMEGAERVAARNFRTQVKEDTGIKEFASLLKSFNVMMKEIDRYHGIQIEKILEEKQKTDLLMSRMQDALILCDLSGYPLYTSETAKKILRIRRRPEDSYAGGREEERKKISEIVKLKAYSKDGTVEFESDGKKKHYRVSVDILSGGQTPLAQGMSSKSTAIRRIDDIASEGQAKPVVFVIMKDITLETEVQKIKEDFFNAVAHDLRVPLLTMQGYIKLLENSPLGEKNSNYVGNIKNSSARLFSMIRNILDISRMDAGSFKLKISDIDPEKFLEKIFKNFEVICSGKQIDISLKFHRQFEENINFSSTGGEQKIRGDEGLLERVMENLLSNAVRFTPQGGRITVEYALASDRALVSVSDTGPGIPHDRINSLFEKHKQVVGIASDTCGTGTEPPALDEPEARCSGRSAAVPLEEKDNGDENRGFGLGLAISKRIVQMHGGAIRAESEQGKGSKFIVELPFDFVK